MKFCKCCGETLPYSEFYKSKGNKDGFRTACKECFKEAEAERRAAMSDSEKEDWQETIRDWKDENSELVKGYRKKWKKKNRGSP